MKKKNKEVLELRTVSSINYPAEGGTKSLQVISQRVKYVNGREVSREVVDVSLRGMESWSSYSKSQTDDGYIIDITLEENQGSYRGFDPEITQEGGKRLTFSIGQDEGVVITYDDIAYMQNNHEGIEENERDGFYTQRYPQGVDVTLHFWIRRWRLENGVRKDYEDLVAEPRIDYNDTDNYTARISSQNQGDVICRKTFDSDYTASIGFTLTYEGSKQISFYIDFQ